MQPVNTGKIPVKPSCCDAQGSRLTALFIEWNCVLACALAPEEYFCEPRGATRPGTRGDVKKLGKISLCKISKNGGCQHSSRHRRRSSSVPQCIAAGGRQRRELGGGR